MHTEAYNDFKEIWQFRGVSSNQLAYDYLHYDPNVMMNRLNQAVPLREEKEMIGDHHVR